MNSFRKFVSQHLSMCWLRIFQLWKSLLTGETCSKHWCHTRGKWTLSAGNYPKDVVRLRFWGTVDLVLACNFFVLPFVVYIGWTPLERTCTTFVSLYQCWHIYRIKLLWTCQRMYRVETYDDGMTERLTIPCNNWSNTSERLWKSLVLCLFCPPQQKSYISH